MTGLVPIDKQEAAYAETFRPAAGYNPESDHPEYLGYWVQRLEVTTADEAAHPDWSKAAAPIMSSKAIQNAKQQWQGVSATDVVGPEYIGSLLVFPLGPMVNRSWDASAACEPEIPMLKVDEPGSQNPGAMSRSTAGRSGAGMSHPTRTFAAPRMRTATAQPGGHSGQADTADTPFDTGSDHAATDAARGNQGEISGAGNEKKAPAYKLFRFFDFNVEPGKKYVYRVCLGLANPNKHMRASLLAKPELATVKFLQTKWSESSPPITVPGSTRLLLVSVKPAHAANEPSGEILAIHWAHGKGIEAYKELPVASVKWPILPTSSERLSAVEPMKN